MKNRFQEREFSFLSTRVRKSRLMSQYPEPSPSYIYPSKTPQALIYTLFLKSDFKILIWTGNIYGINGLLCVLEIFNLRNDFQKPYLPLTVPTTHPLFNVLISWITGRCKFCTFYSHVHLLHKAMDIEKFHSTQNLFSAIFKSLLHKKVSPKNTKKSKLFCHGGRQNKTSDKDHTWWGLKTNWLTRHDCCKHSG